MTLVLRIPLRAMYRSERMPGRRVKRIELQWAVACVYDIVPRARRNNDSVTIVHVSLLHKIISAVAHIYLGSAAFNTNELIHTLMHLNSDIAANGNAHKSELHIAPRPKRCSEIFIHIGCVVDIKDHRLAPVVAYFGMGAAIVFSHSDTSLPFKLGSRDLAVVDVVMTDHAVS